MELKLTFADLNILLHWNFEGLNIGVLGEFASEFEKADVTYSINLMNYDLYKKICGGETLCELDGKRFVRFENKLAALFVHNPNRPYFTLFNDDFNRIEIFISEKEMMSASLMELLFFECLLPSFDGFMLHSSLISYQNMGIMFSAPSQTGKSTQAKLWQEYKGATIINGDRSILRLKDDNWWANGSPWAGTSGIRLAKNVPVRALIVLRQAPENTIERLSPISAAKAVISEGMMPYWSEQMMNKTLELVNNFACNVPTYLLKCRPDEEAVEIVNQMLLKDL